MNYYHPSVFEIRLNFIKNKKKWTEKCDFSRSNSNKLKFWKRFDLFEQKFADKQTIELKIIKKKLFEE